MSEGEIRKIIQAIIETARKAQPSIPADDLMRLTVKVAGRVCPMLDSDALKEEIIGAGSYLFSQGFMPGTSGNISARTGNGSILITPSGISKGRITKEYIVALDGDGNVLDGAGRPSSEAKMHLACYRCRPDVRAVVHAHPPYSTAFAAARIPLDMPVLPEAILVLGKVPLVEYSTPSTREVPENLEPYLAGHNAFLLANHGALTLGESIREASHRMETMETMARVIAISRILGGEKPLSPDEIRRLVRSSVVGDRSSVL
jgi:L-fuculose-phosphate aldolase